MYQNAIAPQPDNNRARITLSLHNHDRLEALKDHEAAWDELLTRIPRASPFLSPDWVHTWWECFGAGNKLMLILGWQGERLIGIAPLMLSRETWYGIPVRRLGTLYNSQVQEMDFPVEPSHVVAFHQALWSWLLARAGSWDVLQLCQFPEDSASLRLLGEMAGRDGFATGFWHQGRSPYLNIEQSWDDYFNGLSANRRADVRRKTRKLAACGQVSLNTVRGGAELMRDLTEGLSLEARAWKGDQGTAILSNRELHCFYRKLATRLAAKQTLRLDFLKVGKRRIAFQYGIESAQAIHLLKPGYDPAWAVYSPSQMLTALVLRATFDSGKREYSFLGDSDDWKLHWTQSTRGHDWLYILPRTARGRLLETLKFRALPAVRSLISARSPAAA